MEFAVEGSVSFNEAERKFVWGPSGRYINSVPLWIKILLCEKGVASMENDIMSNSTIMHHGGGGRLRDG